MGSILLGFIRVYVNAWLMLEVVLGCMCTCILTSTRVFISTLSLHLSLTQHKGAEVDTGQGDWGAWLSLFILARDPSFQSRLGNVPWVGWEREEPLPLITFSVLMLSLDPSFYLEQDSLWDSRRWPPKVGLGKGPIMCRNRCALPGKREHRACVRVSGDC